MTYQPLAAGSSGDLAYAVGIERGRAPGGPSGRAVWAEDLQAVAAAFDTDVVFAAHSSGAVCLLGAAARGLPAYALVVYEPPWPVEGRRSTTDELDEMDAQIAAGDPQAALETGFLKLVGLPLPAIDALKLLSPAYLRGATAAVAAALPNATVVELVGSGHGALQTAPHDVATAIAQTVGLTAGRLRAGRS